MRRKNLSQAVQCECHGGAGCAGCYVFGHSAGGLAAVLAEQRQPGTFKAMYLYEPVCFSQGRDIPGM